MARDEDLALAVLQGVGTSQVGSYPPSVLGLWPPLQTLDEAALRHSRAGSLIIHKRIFGPRTVFAASMQWADAVNVVSRGTPRSQTSVIWGIRWPVSAAEKDGEACTFVGVDW